VKTLLLLLLPSIAGCAQLLGGDHDYTLDTGGAGAGGAPATTSSGGGGETTTLECPSGLTTCGAACADLASDEASCGYCGHDCLGRACNDGLCEPTVLEAGLFYPDSLAVDQTHVFFTTEDGTVQRVPKLGGVPDVLGSGLGVPWSIALQGGHAYWVDRKTKVLQRIAKNGTGAVKTLCAPQLNMDRIAVGPQGAYFVIPFDPQGNPPGSIGQVPLAGGDVTWVATNLSYPHFLTLAGDRLYFGTAVTDGKKFSDGAVNQVPIGGGQPATIATGEVVPQDLAWDGEAVYWVNDVAQSIRKKTIATGEITTLATDQDAPYTIALDQDYVYWATLFAGTVARVPKAGGPVQTLASGRERPLAVAVDGQRVYWVESTTTGAVMSVPK
jgi:hypothetical protein